MQSCNQVHSLSANQKIKLITTQERTEKITKEEREREQRQISIMKCEFARGVHESRKKSKEPCRS